MERYMARKQALLRKHLISIMHKYDSEAAHGTELYDLLQDKQFHETEQEKREYAFQTWQIINRNSLENNLLDNMFQIIDFQDKRITCLEHQLKKQMCYADTLEDLNKLRNAYNVISQDIEYAAKKQPLKEKHGLNIKIAMFTPLPPLKNGIADYSVSIIRELSKYFSIDIFIDDIYSERKNCVPEMCQILYHFNFEKRYTDYDLIIYQVGNNPDHAYMVPYILKYPGIIVLHDFNLGYLRSFLNKKLQVYCDENCYSVMEYEKNNQQNPFNLYLLKKAQGIIVHSEYSAVGILEQDFSRKVCIIPHYSEQERNDVDKQLLRVKYHLKDEIVIASFGFVTMAKRIGTVLKVFAQLLKEYPEKSFRYFIVGKADETQTEEISQIIRKHKLEKYVTLTGYITLDSFEEYINLTDICINLRYPYGGETSGTLSRILGKGKACIVTDVGAFSEVPDNCCIKLPNEILNEEQNLLLALRAFIERPELATEVGENGRKYVQEELSLEKVGRAYQSFIYNILNGTINNHYLKLERIAAFIACNYFHCENSCINWTVKQMMEEIWGENNEDVVI